MNEYQQPTTFSDAEIFTKIWTSPRKVFAYINDNHYDKFLIVLLFLAGIARAFDRAVGKDMGDKAPLWMIVVLAIVIGGLLGWISYLIYAAFVSWTGKWLNGQGNTRSILRIMAYASIPSCLALVLLIPKIGVYGNELFMSDGDLTSAGWIGNVIFWSSFLLGLVLEIWSIVLFVIGVSEVQKFSKWKAFFNLLLPILFLVAFVLIVAFLIVLIKDFK